MAEAHPHRPLLRHHGGGHAPVSYLELFFDLVYVFAITQLSHFLHEHLSLIGFVEGLALFLAVWWAWMFTTWSANWANPESLPVRLMLLALMLLSLMMSIALPEAFAGHGLLFAGSYVALQVGRTLCMALIFGGADPAGRRNMVRIAIWFMASAVLWLLGAWHEGTVQLGYWLAALAIEYIGPLCYFILPGLGRSSPADWNISGSHMAERAGLFIIIALGEAIVVTGSAMGDAPLEPGRVSAFLLAFLGSVLLWWLYFDLGAERGAQHIGNHAQPGRVARNAYTYLHMPIVAGVVVFAVADELLLEHWQEAASKGLIVAQCGGALAFLGSLGLFKRQGSRFGNFPLSHWIGMALLALLAAWAWIWPMAALAFAGWSVAALALVAVWEWGSFHGGWQERWNRLGRKA